MSDTTRDGAQHFPGALGPDLLSRLLTATAHLPADRPGLRLTGVPEIARHLAADGTIGRIAATALGPSVMPVRAVLFDKSAAMNWSLPWHRVLQVDYSAADLPGSLEWLGI